MKVAQLAYLPNRQCKLRTIDSYVYVHFADVHENWEIRDLQGERMKLVDQSNHLSSRSSPLAIVSW